MHRLLGDIPSLRGAVCVVALLLAVGLPRAPALGHDQGVAQTATSGTSIVRGLRPLLSGEDARLYREIFALQAKGAWGDADKRIGRLNDRVLLGHLLAQRYLHPTSYRSKFSELAAWLDHYPDHPQAARIYRLAKIRRTSGARAPRAPERVSMRVGAPPDGEPYSSSKELSRTGEATRVLRKDCDD